MISIDSSFLEGKDADEVYIILYVLTHADDNGDFIMSYKDLSDNTNISIKKVRTIIEKFSNDGARKRAQLWARKRARNTTLLSVENIDDYKVVGSKKGTKKGTIKGTTSGTISVNDSDNILNVKKESIDLQKLTQFFNEKVRGTMIPTIVGIFDKRRETVKARVLTYGKQAVFTVINSAVESDFLSGRSSDFFATFDWLFGVKNFQKVLDGNYRNDRGSSAQGLGKSGSGQRLNELERAISALENG